MNTEEAIKVQMRDAVKDVLDSGRGYNAKIQELMRVVDDFADPIAEARKKSEYPPSSGGVLKE